MIEGSFNKNDNMEHLEKINIVSELSESESFNANWQIIIDIEIS